MSKGYGTLSEHVKPMGREICATGGILTSSDVRDQGFIQDYDSHHQQFVTSARTTRTRAPLQ